MKRVFALILAFAAVFSLAACGGGRDASEFEPNLHFGMVEEVYTPDVVLPVSDLSGDTDVFSVDEYRPYESDSVYEDYERFTSPSDTADALTLHFGITNHLGRRLALTSRRYEQGMLIPDEKSDGKPSVGIVEKRGENGEWTTAAPLKPEIGEHVIENPSIRIVPADAASATLAFPLHEPGEYRFTYYLRKFSYDGLSYSTGEELYTVSHTYTVPEPTDSKFDLILPDFYLPFGGSQSGTRQDVRLAVLIRSNDGTIPYQDLSATRLEHFSGGEWTEVRDDRRTPVVTRQYDTEAENPDISSAKYVTVHPFTGEEVENLFCGTAEFYIPDTRLRYRLTIEFVENADGSGERYPLQLDLDFSQYEPIDAGYEPEPESPFGFGALREDYSPFDRSGDTVECFGDTGLLAAKHILWGGNPYPETIMFSFTARSDIALTTDLYRDGELVQSASADGLGTIERVEDGEWMHYATLGEDGAMLQYAEGSPPYPVHGKESDFSAAFRFSAYDEEEGRYKSYEPGFYRMTLNFRESISAETDAFTTSDALYSIQILFSIGEASDAQFDLVSVGFRDSFDYDGTFRVVPFVRANAPDAQLCFDLSRTRLERRRGGKWVEAEPREGQVSAVESLLGVDSPNRYSPSGGVTVYVTDRTASHRLIYEYVENVDGSGERGTLTIPLDLRIPTTRDGLVSVDGIGWLSFGDALATYDELSVIQSEFLDLVWGETREPVEALGVSVGSIGTYAGVNAVVADVFAPSRAAFDEFLRLYGDRISEHVYFKVRYGIDIAATAVHPDTAPPPPPTEPVDTGITLHISDVTRTSASLSFSGYGSGYITGESYEGMDVWNGEEWVQIPLRITWRNMMGYNLANDFEVDWSYNIGVLPPGYYRIMKDAHLSGDNRCYYAQFVITESTPEK